MVAAPPPSQNWRGCGNMSEMGGAQESEAPFRSSSPGTKRFLWPATPISSLQMTTPEAKLRPSHLEDPGNLAQSWERIPKTATPFIWFGLFMLKEALTRKRKGLRKNKIQFADWPDSPVPLTDSLPQFGSLAREPRPRRTRSFVISFHTCPK